MILERSKKEMTSLAAIAVLFFVSIALVDSLALESDTDRPGMDYHNLDSPTSSLCEQACMADPNCQAFTYVRSGNLCYLKNGIPAAVPKAGCDSGVKGTASGGESKVIFDNWNKGVVDNNPSCSPSFTVNEPHMITYIDTYHWNYGSGTQSGGTITLRKDDGTEYGPWQVETKPGMYDVPNAWWIAYPNEVIPAGTYQVVDSDVASWSQNSESQGCGFSKVEGYLT